MAEKSRSEFEERLVELAGRNPELRKQLLTAPKEAIADILRTDFPDGLDIHVHEEDKNTLHFVLPNPGDELNAAELSGVSGGLCWGNCDEDTGP